MQENASTRYNRSLPDFPSYVPRAAAEIGEIRDGHVDVDISNLGSSSDVPLNTTEPPVWRDLTRAGKVGQLHSSYLINHRSSRIDPGSRTPMTAASRLRQI